jgi:phenylalanyl-tRNA synthetase beta chain
MNIKFTHNWLKESLKTSAPIEEIAKGLTLCGPVEIEKLEKINDDLLYQFEVTNNRPDAFSVLGIARECQAILPQFNYKAKCVPLKGIKLNLQPETIKTLTLKVKITKKDLCPRFTAIILDHIKIKPSPKKISMRLESAGIRAINNVVDVSNYLMLELGQPMHTFDFDKIINSKMILRESKKGEKIITLDGVERTLPEGAIVIEDEKRLIDLCGIMGGLLSEVDKNTKKVLLFVQTYNPQIIRKTTQAINHRTEASSRFEKGLDTESVLPAISRAVYLLKKYAQARIASELIDIYPTPYKPYLVSLSFTNLYKYLNIQIPKKEVKKTLQNLDLKIQKINSKKIEVLIPSWRAQDIKIEEDLIEEVARIFGYHNIIGKLPQGSPPPKDKSENQTFYWENVVKETLKNWGFYETYTSSLVSKSEVPSQLVSHTIKLKNPLNEDLEYLRPSLLPSLIKVNFQNFSLRKAFGYFELANVYQKRGEGLPLQNKRLAVIINEMDFKKAKGILEGLIITLKIKDLKLIEKNLNDYHDNLSFEVKTKDILLGTFGKLKTQTKKGNSIFAFNLNFEEISKTAKVFNKYSHIPKFPPLIEDLDIIIEEKIPVGEVIETIKQAVKPNISNIQLIDLYKNNKIGQNNKSITFRITYQAKNRTLTSKETTIIREKIKKALEEKFKAKTRQ